MLSLLLSVALQCGDLCRADAAAHYTDLLARAGYGRLQVEHAGFLIREDDGTITCAPWPRGSFQRARYRGAIPRGTIAVVHTHPRGQANASPHDVEEAQRIRLPIVVITPRAATVVHPDGTSTRLPW